MLVIDARKAFDAGIGTYIRSVVPRVLGRIKGVPSRLLVQPGSEAQHLQYLPHGVAELRPVSAPPWSLAEQRELRRSLPSSAVFWATSLAHPLFCRSRLMATVHDVAQLVLPFAHAGGPVAWAASRVFFSSLQHSADVLLFNSHFTRREYEANVGLPRVASVTPLGVDPEWFRASETAVQRPARPYFLCVGNIRPHKNLSLLLAAFADAVGSVPHDLVIVGRKDGFRTQDPAFGRALAALGDRVRFLGWVDDAELRSLVARAEAMVFPSLYEGFGLPAAEAMAAGCAVLSSTAGALQEVCGESALYFDPRDRGALARLLVQVGQGDIDLQVLRRTGVERARTFDWDRTADLSAAALLPLLAAPSRDPVG